jgi:enoyl-CoA hydratase/carnithine racemase
MTGRGIPAREAEQYGLVNMVVPDDEVDARALEMAVQTAAMSPDTIQLCIYGKRSSTMIGN